MRLHCKSHSLEFSNCLTVNVPTFYIPQCESETGKVLCPEPPPIIVQGGPIVTRVILLIMESIGAEGVVGFFGGLILILGFIKLSFGGVICCRKTKAQEYADRQRERGAVPKGMCGFYAPME